MPAHFRFVPRRMFLFLLPMFSLCGAVPAAALVHQSPDSFHGTASATPQYPAPPTGPSGTMIDEAVLNAIASDSASLPVDIDMDDLVCGGNALIEESLEPEPIRPLTMNAERKLQRLKSEAPLLKRLSVLRNAEVQLQLLDPDISPVPVVPTMDGSRLQSVKRLLERAKTKEEKAAIVKAIRPEPALYIELLLEQAKTEEEKSAIVKAMNPETALYIDLDEVRAQLDQAKTEEEKNALYKSINELSDRIDAFEYRQMTFSEGVNLIMSLDFP